MKTKNRLIIITSIVFLVISGFPNLCKAQSTQLMKYYEGESSISLEKRGYAIITTRNIATGLNQLHAFAEHKSKLGFNVHIITEEDFGGGRGEDAAFNIRRWLKANYKRLDLLYVLLMGDPTPNCGDIPMKVVSMGTKDDSGELIPSDYYYADLSGNWDINNNGIVGDRSDFKEGGLDGVWEVLVGRLLYYGEDSEWFKLEDLDVLLKRFIDYDNEENIAWRYNFFVYRPNQELFASWVGKYLEPNGINYVLMSETKEWAGLSRPDYISGDGHNRYQILQDNDFGHIKLQSHGTPTATWGVNSDGISQKLTPNKPGIVQFAGCFTGSPEKSNNIGGAMLRFYAIATEPNTMGVTAFTAPGPKVGKKPVMNNRKIKLLQGKSVGYAHWEDYADISRYGSNTVGNTMLKHNLYGDPSIVVFRNGIDVPSSVVVTPVKQSYFNIESDNKAGAQVYTVWSNVDGEKLSSVSVDVNWLDYTIIGSSNKKENAIDVKIETNANVDLLGGGEHVANIEFKGSDGKITKRKFFINIKFSRQIAYYSFEGKGNKYLNEQLNISEGYKILPVKKGEMTSADVKSIIKQAKVEGKVKEGLSCASDLSPYGYECNFLPFNNTGSSTHSFWLKLGSQLPADGQILNFSKGVMTFGVVDGKYVLTCKENDHYAWQKNSDYIVAKRIESASLVTDEWIYFSFVVDRTKNKLIFYQNAIEKASVDLIDKSSLFADKSLIINPFGGVIDELASYNYALSPDEINNEKLGLKITPIHPENNNNVMSNKKVLFEWSSLDGAISYNFYISENLDDLLPDTPSIRVRNFKDSKFVKQNLLQDRVYYWRVDAVLDDGKTIKGMIFNFTVPKTLWDLKKLSVAATDVFTFDAIDELRYTTIQFFSEYSATLRKSPVTIELFTLNENNEEVILASRRFNIGNKGTYIAQEFEVNSDYIGSEIKIRIKGEKGTYELKNTALFVEHGASDGKSASFNKSEIQLENIKVGELSLSYDLTDDVDQINNVVEFKLVNAPSWIQMQDNILVSFRAPQSADIGDYKFTIRLLDKKGNTSQMQAGISVSE
jgi:hypothetical protein